MVASGKYPTSQSALALPAALEAAAAITRLASATHRQPKAILLIGNGSGPSRAWRAHSRTISGVNTKIISGLSARDHGGGNSPRQNPKTTDRAVRSSAQSRMGLP